MMKKNIKIISAICLVFIMTACQFQESITEDSSNETVENDSKVLIAYFSLYGNVDYDEDADASTSASIVIDDNQRLGTTEYVADIIQNKTGGTQYLIETDEKYSNDFQTVIDQNHREQNQDTLPQISGHDIQIDEYDVIFIGYPVWSSGIPQVIRSFMEKYDLSEKTVIPFCTHNGYGSGNSYDEIQQYSKSKNMLEGIAIDSQEILESESQIEEWFNSLDLNINNGSQEISIQIGDYQLVGQLNDSQMAQQLKTMLPLTVSMINYGNREFYGTIDTTIEIQGSGQLFFENGDITYCPTNNSLAIFYNQSDNPNLTMEVYVIGEVTSDLERFHELSSREDITFALK